MVRGNRSAPEINADDIEGTLPRIREKVDKHGIISRPIPNLSPNPIEHARRGHISRLFG